MQIHALRDLAHNNTPTTSNHNLRHLSMPWREREKDGKEIKIKTAAGISFPSADFVAK